MDGKQRERGRTRGRSAEKTRTERRRRFLLSIPLLLCFCCLFFFESSYSNPIPLFLSSWPSERWMGDSQIAREYGARERESLLSLSLFFEKFEQLVFFPLYLSAVNNAILIAIRWPPVCFFIVFLICPLHFSRFFRAVRYLNALPRRGIAFLLLSTRASLMWLIRGFSKCVYKSKEEAEIGYCLIFFQTV